MVSSVFGFLSYDLRSLGAAPQNVGQHLDSQRLMICINFKFFFNYLENFYMEIMNADIMTNKYLPIEDVTLSFFYVYTLLFQEKNGCTFLILLFFETLRELTTVVIPLLTGRVMVEGEIFQLVSPKLK